MSKIFNHQWATFDDAGLLHSFGPGDPVPEWAEARLGDHMVSDAQPVAEGPENQPADGDEPEEHQPEAEAVEQEPAEAETPEEGDDAEEGGELEAEAAPDFTQPARTRRAPSRRKS